MGDVGLLHTQAGRSDEPLVLGSLPGEIVAHEGTLGHHPLPSLSSLGSRPHHLEHLIVGHRLDLRNRDLPLPGLLLALLLDGVTQDLGAADSLPIEQIRGNGTLGDGVVVRVLIGSLVVLSNRLAHGGLLLEPTLVVQLGTDSVDLLRELGTLMGKASLPLPFAFLCIEPASVQLSVPFNVFVLRHGFGLFRNTLGMTLVWGRDMPGGKKCSLVAGEAKFRWRA